MFNSFSQFLVEEEKTVFFTFGRMNPPTIGHGKLLDVLSQKSGSNPYRVFLSQSQDRNKNPLKYQEKIKFARKLFPKHARSIMMNKKVNNPMAAASALYDEGFINLVMVVGSDRLREFDILLNKYNGKKSTHGFYNFKSIKVISAGERDPDSEGVEGMSASKMRGFAKDNDFVSFSQGLPKAVSNPDAKKMFNTIRKAMGLKEAKQFKNHVQLEPVSELREAYIRDNIFEKGDQVVMTRHGIVGNIQHLGTNYVIVESKGETWRCWLDDISKVDPNQQVNWDVQDIPNDDFDGVIREALNEETTPYEWGTDASTKHAKKMTPGQNESLWANIWAKRARGERMRKKGEKGAPTPDALRKAKGEDVNEYGGPPISRKKYLKQKPMQEKIQVRQDPDIDDRKGSQPATFQMGIKSKSTKAARDAHFKKMSKRDDHGNPDLYKDAPGDKKARAKGTKPSQYTKKFKQMYGDD
jgi:hypothetical protein